MRAAALLLTVALLAGVSCYDPEARRQEILARAEAHEATGDLEGAADILEGALSADPRDVPVRRALAEHWRRRGDLREAKRVLGGLPSDVPRDAAYQLALTRLSVEIAPVRSAALALPVLESAEELDPMTRDRFLRRWVRSGADPELLEPLSATTRLAAVELLIAEERLISAAEAWRVLAAEEARGGQLLDALVEAALRAETWTALEELEPELRVLQTPGAELALHRVLVRRGAWAEAEALEHDFLERYPDHPQRYALILTRARRESRSGSPEEGLRLAREAARLRPDRADGFVEQAVALQALGRDDEALGAVNSALLVEPSHKVALRLAADLKPAQPVRSEHRLSIDVR